MSEIKDLKQEGVKINLGGKERRLIFDFNDFANFEDEYGNLDKALEATKSIKGTRRFLWVALKHENKDITEEEAGALVTMPESNKVMEKLREAIWGNLPKQEKNVETKEAK